MIDQPPPGFSAFDPQRAVTIRRRHMPHWRQAGATYFVTFRLADSLPITKLAQWRAEHARWKHEHPTPSDDERTEQQKAYQTKVERWLDQGSGCCILADANIASIVEERLRYVEGEQYSLFAFVIMPNHVHACLRPMDDHDLDTILQAWKSISARMINRKLGRNGQLWQDECFDRVVRDAPHLRRVIHYIEGNPGKAGISNVTCWTTPVWNKWLNRSA
jgi:REP element-mobilizing transposase RayT